MEVVPVLDNVAAIFLAIIPVFPKPVTITLPEQLYKMSIAFSISLFIRSEASIIAFASRFNSFFTNSTMFMITPVILHIAFLLVTMLLPSACSHAPAW